MKPVVNLSDEQNDFSLLMLLRMGEIEEISAKHMLNGHEFNHTIDDDQINSNIQFDSVKGNVNSGSVEKDTHVYDLCALETLARICIWMKLLTNNKRVPQKVQQQNMALTSQIEIIWYRDIGFGENLTKDNNYLKEFLEADDRAKRVQNKLSLNCIVIGYIRD
ncbi:hypothetical protein Tco_1246890 [Tanacetum coccineum]